MYIHIYVCTSIPTYHIKAICFQVSRRYHSFLIPSDGPDPSLPVLHEAEAAIEKHVPLKAVWPIWTGHSNIRAARPRLRRPSTGIRRRSTGTRHAVAFLANYRRTTTFLSLIAFTQK